jgi:exopolyphosphatase/guanosine-5'-triphosphate,3'-diphosphate pyrophosphatase
MEPSSSGTKADLSTPSGTTPGPVATIDVGTNTTLLLVARPRMRAPLSDAEVLVDAAEITRLGRGIGKTGDGKPGHLGEEGIQATLVALEIYARTAAHYGAAITAVGTEALRRAPNAAAFLEPAGKILGAPVAVIDGEREADLTFRAVHQSFAGEMAHGRAAVVDIGGGSTEIIIADRGAVTFRRSLPLGSVRLHERHLRHDPPLPSELIGLEAEVSATLDQIPQAFSSAGGTGAMPTVLVGVAGTVTSLAAMTMNLASYDSARVHGAVLSMQDIDAQVARLARATQAERQQIPGLDPRRADVILAGVLLLRAIARRADVQAVRVSDRGIRWGLFYERAQAVLAVR